MAEDMRARIEAALADDAFLPPGHLVMAEIARLSRDPESDARDLARVIQTDQALTSKLLKLVNSAYFGLSSTVGTVTQAVVILGFQEVRAMALSVPAADFFRSRASEGGIDIQQLWEHTLFSACVARAVAYHIDHPLPEQVFVAGIIQNIGEVVLNDLLDEGYAKLVEEAGLDEDHLPAMEIMALGISHVEAGEMLARRWRFPEELARSIRLHHEPLTPDGVHPEGAAVFMANRLIAGDAAGETPYAVVAEPDPEIVRYLRLTGETAGAVFERGRADYRSVLATFEEWE